VDRALLERRLEELRGRHLIRARRSLVVVLVLLTIAVIIRVILDPLATHLTRKALDDLHGFRGDVQSVHVTIFPPGYEARRLRIIEDPGGSWREPLFFAERAAVVIDVRRLLHAELVGRARVDHPKIVVLRRPTEKPAKPTAPPDLSRQLNDMIGMRVDRVEVFDGEVLLRDLTQPRRPELWLHRLALTAENLATRRSLEHGRPATVEAAGELGKSGRVSLFVSADPLARPLRFAGRASLTAFDVAELYDLVEPAPKMKTPEGTLDVFAEFKSENGRITGGVKPVLKNVKVEAAEGGLGTRLKAWAADEALHLFSDRVPGRNAVATVIPIEGKLTAPDVELWPTVLEVVRNAFVEGLASGYASVPPEKAEKKESKLEQAKHAVEKSKDPPKAQPEEKK